MACYFVDEGDRKWVIRPDGDIVERWKLECGINVFELLDDRCALLERVTKDVFAQMEMIWVACREQAEEEGIASRKEFARLLAGDVLLAAITALWEGIGNFFPHQETRALFGELLEKGRATARIVNSTQLANLKKVDPAAVASILSGTTISSVESPASTPPQ